MSPELCVGVFRIGVLEREPGIVDGPVSPFLLGDSGEEGQGVLSFTSLNGPLDPFLSFDCSLSLP